MKSLLASLKGESVFVDVVTLTEAKHNLSLFSLVSLGGLNARVLTALALTDLPAFDCSGRDLDLQVQRIVFFLP